MAANLELFVSDDGGSRGPLPVAQVRREISDGHIRPAARFRAGEAHVWLPGSAWEALADLLPAARTPAPPKGGVGTSTPEDLVGLPAAMRDRLLWFVADVDGVMGPVSGEFVRQGIRTGKIPLSAAVSLASWTTVPVWTRAVIVFPTSEGATTVRRLPVDRTPCAYCLEPMLATDAICGACGEAPRAPEMPRAAQAGAAAMALAAVTIVALGVAALARAGGARADVPPAAASAPASSSAAPAAPDAAPAGEGGPQHLLTGKLATRAQAARDAADALALSERWIAVATPAALEIVDARSGAPLFTAPDLAGATSLHRAGSAVYAAVGDRLAAVDPGSARAVAWIDATGDAPPGLALAAGRRVVVVPDPARRRVHVLDAVRHAEVGRWSFLDAITTAAVDERGDVALCGAGDARTLGAGEGAAYAFDPTAWLEPDGSERTPAATAEPSAARIAGVRRIALGDAPSGVAVSPDGAFGVAALKQRSEVARVDLTPAAALDPAGPRGKTCTEPSAVAIAAGVIVVACRAGRAVVLHDSSSLTALKSIELGGPAIGLDVSPDGAQALVTVGAPANAIAVVDVAGRDARMIPAGEPIGAARYGVGGRVATAMSSRTGRLLVLR